MNMVATAANPQQMAQVIQELERIKRSKIDLIVPHSKIMLDLVQDIMSPGTPQTAQIIVSADHYDAKTQHATQTGEQWEDLNPTPLALEQLCSEKLGINPPYFRRLRDEAHDLLVQNANYWLEHDSRNFMLRTLDGQLRAVLSDQFRRLDNYDLFFKAFEMLELTGAKITSLELSDEKFWVYAGHPTMRVNIASPSLVGTPNEDWVYAAIRISNSEVGRGGLEVTPSLIRARGGLRIARKSSDDDDLTIRQIHLGQRLKAGILSVRTEDLADATFWSGVQDVIKAIFTQEKFEAQVLQLQGLSEQKLENIVEAVEIISKELQISDDRKAQILTAMAQGGDATMLGLLTAIAGHAQGQEVDERAKLETYAGKLMDKTPAGIKLKKEPDPVFNTTFNAFPPIVLPFSATTVSP